MISQQLTHDDYMEICRVLNIDPETDNVTVRYLNQKLHFLKVRRAVFRSKRIIQNRITFIFGAGPSLSNIVKIIKPIYNKFSNQLTIIAVDGAAEALLENDIKIDIIISDLDGNIDSIKESYRKDNSIIVIHGHGDNLEKIKSISQLLPQKNIIGSTQTKNYLNVRNYGGFTDGDRAAYFAANFRASDIVLLAFDFGNLIGKYSKPNFTSSKPASKSKKIKLDIAKELLSKLPKLFPKITFHNFTPDGEDIPNIQKLTQSELLDLISKKG